MSEITVDELMQNMRLNSLAVIRGRVVKLKEKDADTYRRLCKLFEPTRESPQPDLAAHKKRMIAHLKKHQP